MLLPELEQSLNSISFVGSDATLDSFWWASAGGQGHDSLKIIKIRIHNESVALVPGSHSEEERSKRCVCRAECRALELALKDARDMCTTDRK